MGYSGNLYAQATEVITTQGDLRRGDSSGNPERLAIGSSGKVLQSNGTTESWETLSLADSVLTTKGAAANPVWAAAAGGGALQPLSFRLPQESTETVVVDELYRIGAKDWKVTQIEKPIKFEAADDSNLIAINDDMTGYSNDTEFDAVWVSDDATNIAPNASANQIDCAVPNGADATCYFDLGHTIADNARWQLSFAWQTTQVGTGNKKAFFGLSSSSSATFNTSQSAIGFGLDDQAADKPMKCGTFSVQSGTLDQGFETGTFPYSPSPLEDTTQRSIVLCGNGFGFFSAFMYDALPYGMVNQENIDPCANRVWNWADMGGGTVTTGLRYLKINCWSKSSGTAPEFNITNVQFTENDQSVFLNNLS